MSPYDEPPGIPGHGCDNRSPARGPVPGSVSPRLSPLAVVIIVIIIVSVLWLLAGGYSAAVALGIIAAALRLATSFAGGLASRPPRPEQ